jgi:chitin disaccharide deacetylase
MLSNSIRKGYSVNEKIPALKRFSPSFLDLSNLAPLRKSLPERESMTLNHKIRFLLFSLFVSLLPSLAQTVRETPVPKKTVQERLGYPASARLLVIHADDLGMSHSVNRAIFEALEKGWVTSASILVPCPWFPEVVKWAREHPNADLGIHQALNSEWSSFRWGPVSPKDKVPTLLDPDGYLPLDTPAVTQNAKLSEVETELREQVDRAQAAGIHLTHLDTHMGALFGSNDLYRLYQKMGHAYALPILEARTGTHAPEAASPPAEEVLVEKVIEIDPGIEPQDWASWYRKQLEPLGPGVYQVIVHLAYDDDEMRGATFDHPDWGAAWRQHDLDMVKSPEFRQFLKEQGFLLVGWRDLAKALPPNHGGPTKVQATEVRAMALEREDR